MSKKGYLIIFLILLSVLLLYFPSLNYYFSQDDFIHLSASKVTTISQFLNFFNPYIRPPDIFFYRPLTTEVWFFINQSLFGLNPLPFRIEALLLHLTNTVLFFVIVKKLFQNNRIAYLASWMYGVSAIHFLSLFYISAFQELGKTFFIFLGLLAFLKYMQDRKVQYLIFTGLCYLAGLLSKETAIIFPFLLLPMLFLTNTIKDRRIFLKNTIQNILPFLIITLLYISIRLVGFQTIFSEGSYQASISVNNIYQNLKWYLLWSSGLPETISSLPSIKPYAVIELANSSPIMRYILMSTASTILLFAALLVSSRTFISRRYLIFGLLFFFISLLPILPLANHAYPQYLDIAFLGVLPILATVMVNHMRKIFSLIVLLILISFFLTQLFSIRFSEQNHWTTHRSKVAKYYHELLTDNKNLQNKSVAFVGGEQTIKELQVAIAYSYAVKLWYPDQINSVIYTTKSLPLPIVTIPISYY